MTDDVTQRKIEYLAEKWQIPKYEAERMIKNQKAREERPAGESE